MFGFCTVEERAEKVAEFFGVEKPKELSFQQWIDQLFDMEMEWEKDHKEPFPI